MIKLTVRQQEILDLIARSIDQTGFPPTRAEIAAELGFKSVNAAEEHLQALARKGVIEMVPGISRGIRLVQTDVAVPFVARENQIQYSVPLVGVSLPGRRFWRRNILKRITSSIRRSLLTSRTIC